IFREVLGEAHPDYADSLNLLALLYALRGRWEEAARTADQASRVIRRHIRDVLPGLSVPQQLNFLRTKHVPSFHQTLSLGLARRADVEVVGRSAGWVLNGKAVAQEALAEVTLLSQDSNSGPVADLARQLIAVRTELANLTLREPAPGQEARRRQELA